LSVETTERHGSRGGGLDEMFEKVDPKNQSKFRANLNERLKNAGDSYTTGEQNEVNDDKKKGETKYRLDSDEEAKYLGYEPVHPEYLDWAEIKLSDNFAVKSYKNSVYVGQLDPQMRRAGRGVITYGSGRLYEGSWHEDKRHGLGYEKFQSGNTFEGEYVHGKVEGQGRYVWSAGEYYDGQWKDGKKEGHGLWQGTGGDSYIG
jgi:hypothetical protein